MSTTEKPRCTARVYNQWERRHLPCTKRGTVLRDGALFCGIHDPERRRARDEARFAKWARETAIREAEYAIREARDEAADLIERGGVTKAEFAAAQDKIAAARKALDTLARLPHQEDT